jgi:hypothetical protein
MSLEEDAFRAELKELRKRVESLEKWVGNNSELLPKKQETTTNENKTTDPQLVQTTDNHLGKTGTESSAATSTDGLSDNYEIPDL